jgi:hypothetical protein
MYVERRDETFLHIHQDAHVEPLVSLINYINTSYGVFTPTTGVVVQIEDLPVHAMSGGTLTHVPVGCSMSGVVWWYPDCTRGDGTMYFSIVYPQVHPGHVRE